MGLILTKIQFIKQGTNDTISGETPYYEENGKFFLKETGEEVFIIEEEVILL